MNTRIGLGSKKRLGTRLSFILGISSISRAIKRLRALAWILVLGLVFGSSLTPSYAQLAAPDPLAITASNWFLLDDSIVSRGSSEERTAYQSLIDDWQKLDAQQTRAYQEEAQSFLPKWLSIGPGEQTRKLFELADRFEASLPARLGKLHYITLENLWVRSRQQGPSWSPVDSPTYEVLVQAQRHWENSLSTERHRRSGAKNPEQAAQLQRLADEIDTWHRFVEQDLFLKSARAAASHAGSSRSLPVLDEQPGYERVDHSWRGFIHWRTLELQQDLEALCESMEAHLLPNLGDQFVGHQCRLLRERALNLLDLVTTRNDILPLVAQRAIFNDAFARLVLDPRHPFHRFSGWRLAAPDLVDERRAAIEELGYLQNPWAIPILYAVVTNTPPSFEGAVPTTSPASLTEYWMDGDAGRSQELQREAVIALGRLGWLTRQVLSVAELRILQEKARTFNLTESYRRIVRGDRSAVYTITRWKSSKDSHSATALRELPSDLSYFLVSCVSDVDPVVAVEKQVWNKRTLYVGAPVCRFVRDSVAGVAQKSWQAFGSMVAIPRDPHSSDTWADLGPMAIPRHWAKTWVYLPLVVRATQGGASLGVRAGKRIGQALSNQPLSLKFPPHQLQNIRGLVQDKGFSGIPSPKGGANLQVVRLSGSTSGNHSFTGGNLTSGLQIPQNSNSFGFSQSPGPVSTGSLALRTPVIRKSSLSLHPTHQSKIRPLTMRAPGSPSAAKPVKSQVSLAVVKNGPKIGIDRRTQKRHQDQKNRDAALDAMLEALRLWQTLPENKGKTFHEFFNEYLLDADANAHSLLRKISRFTDFDRPSGHPSIPYRPVLGSNDQSPKQNDADTGESSSSNADDAPIDQEDFEWFLYPSFVGPVRESFPTEPWRWFELAPHGHSATTPYSGEANASNNSEAMWNGFVAAYRFGEKLADQETDLTLAELIEIVRLLQTNSEMTNNPKILLRGFAFGFYPQQHFALAGYPQMLDLFLPGVKQYRNSFGVDIRVLGFVSIDDQWKIDTVGMQLSELWDIHSELVLSVLRSEEIRSILTELQRSGSSHEAAAAELEAELQELTSAIHTNEMAGQGLVDDLEEMLDSAPNQPVLDRNPGESNSTAGYQVYPLAGNRHFLSQYQRILDFYNEVSKRILLRLEYRTEAYLREAARFAVCVARFIDMTHGSADANGRFHRVMFINALRRLGIAAPPNIPYSRFPEVRRFTGLTEDQAVGWVMEMFTEAESQGRSIWLRPE